MANRAYLTSDGAIRENFIGDQTGESVQVMIDQVNKIIAKQRKAKHPVRILVDMRKLGKMNTEARKVGSTVVTKWKGYPVAVFGMDLVTRYLFNMVLRLKPSQKIKSFRNESAARHWLNSR